MRRYASHRTWLRARIDHSIDKRQERSDALKLAQRSKTNEPSSLMGERVRAHQKKTVQRDRRRQRAGLRLSE